MILPSNGALQGADGQNQGFYLLGPGSFPKSGPRAAPTTTLQRPEMQYSAVSFLPPPVMDQPPPRPTIAKPTILLRRLACPGLAPNPLSPSGQPQDPLLPANPYITVDYMEDVRVNERNQPGNASDGRNQPYAGDSGQRHLGGAAVDQGRASHGGDGSSNIVVVKLMGPNIRRSARRERDRQETAR